MNPLVTAGPLKLAVARIITSGSAGWLVGRALNHRIPSHGLVFDTRDPVVSPQVAAQLFFRLYESAEIRLVRRYLAGARTVVDLGSSLGIVAAHALDRMAPEGRIICVEPNPSLLPYLERTTRRHANGREVDVVHAAISYQDGDQPGLLDVRGSSVESRLNEDPTSGTIEVPTLRLRDLVRRLDADEPFALVSDIEGAEAAMILEDGEALRRCSLMIAELHATDVHNRSVTVDDMHDKLLMMGFRVASQQGPVFAFVKEHGHG